MSTSERIPMWANNFLLSVITCLLGLVAWGGANFYSFLEKRLGQIDVNTQSILLLKEQNRYMQISQEQIIIELREIRKNTKP